MTTQSTRDRADADLRALLANADPEAGTPAETPPGRARRGRASRTSWSAARTSPMFRGRRSGSLARQRRTTRSRSGATPGTSAASGRGSSCRMR